MATNKVLIAYSSRFGHSLKIAETMGNVLKDDNVAVDMCNLEMMTALSHPMKEYDAVIITASIRYGKFHPKLNEFIAQYRKELKETLDVFIPINLVARKPEKRLLENNNYVNKFLASVDWEPSMINIMPGALEYPKYNLLDRWMIQLIMLMTKGEMDASKTIDYTDWDEVRDYAKEIHQSLLSKSI